LIYGLLFIFLDWLSPGDIHKYKGSIFRNQVFYESEESVVADVVYYLSIAEENEDGTVLVSFICQSENEKSKLSQNQINLIREICLPELKTRLEKKKPFLPEYLGFGPYEVYSYEDIKKTDGKNINGKTIKDDILYLWNLDYIPDEKNNGVKVLGNLLIDNEKGLVPTERNVIFDIFYIYENEKMKKFEIMLDYLIKPFNISSKLKVSLSLVEDV
tara:strand:+ start:1950 stop:2594 length:645 start_codon:yes stop_codon:yes gene_type:complete